VFQDDNRPVLYLLTSHWLTIAGALLVAVAGCSWLFALPSHIRGEAANPYIGILLFLLLPIVFALGLILMPIGIWLSRRSLRLGQQVPSRKSSLRRLAVFLATATVLNVVIMSQLTYSAITHMEGTQFCGQTCHVMKPEFTAHRISPHAALLCVQCHVTPGAKGWLESKLAGTRQLKEVLFDTFPRPIHSAIETNRLVASSETCEKCHWPQKWGGAKLRVISEFADDETNTLAQTVVMMPVGGDGAGGIHGAHLGHGVSIRYGSTDSTRQTIPWVEYRNSSTTEVRKYVTAGLGQSDEAKLQYYDMQCVDCHNRPAHTFQLPERAVNRAMALGQIPVSLPFVKRKGVEVLRSDYKTSEEAAQKIPLAIQDYYRQSYSDVYQSRSTDIEQAAKALLNIYNENVFPELKVGWGTYTNNLGHIDFPGCFRCHDEAHTSSDEKTITQDCSKCHELVAVSEASPEILNTLGLQKRIAGLQAR
jgi:hypothetical protein